MHCLAGDIGGTKTVLALFAGSADGSFSATRSKRYDSGRYASLTPMVREFLADGNETVSSAGIGVAGPVVDGTCTATNLPWQIDARRLASDLMLDSVCLVNDFVAVALGIPSLQGSELQVLQEGSVDPQGTVAILGAGTGLGEAIMLPTDAEPKIIPTEGGHASMAPRTPREIRLLQYLLPRFGHVSWERVLSGPGIKNIYDFLISEGEMDLPATRKRLEQEDAGSVIGQLAVAGEDPTCVAAAKMFAELYGAEAGDLALKSLASGGVYVAGGIAPRVVSILRSGGFISAFNDKGRMSRLTNNFRVSVVLHPDVGLIGACRAGLGAGGNSKISLRMG